MNEDRDLRRAFDDIRGLEEQAPPFGKVWLAARERLEIQAAGTPRRWLLRAAVALSAAALVVVVLVSAPGLREPAPPFESDKALSEQAQALSDWQAPLDFLLDSPESEMFEPEIWPQVEDASDLTALTTKELL